MDGGNKKKQKNKKNTLEKYHCCTKINWTMFIMFRVGTGFIVLRRSIYGAISLIIILKGKMEKTPKEKNNNSKQKKKKENNRNKPRKK